MFGLAGRPYGWCPGLTEGLIRGFAVVLGPVVSWRQPRDAGLTDEQFEELSPAVIAAADAARVGVLVVDPEPPCATIVFASAAAAGLFGCLPEALVGRSADFLPPAALGSSWQAPSEDVTTAPPALPQCETVIERPDGSRLPIELSYATEQLSGRPLLVAFASDASDRRQAERALLRSEQRFKRLIEAAPEGVLITADGRIVYANPITAELLGQGCLADLLGQDVRELLHPEDVSKFEERAKTIALGGQRLPPTEYRLMRPDGDSVVLELSSIGIEHEGRPAVLSLARDVTERKHAESQLLQADRLSALGMLAGGMAHAINNPLTYVLLNLDDIARRLPEVPSGRSPLSEALARLKEAHQGAERIAGIVRQMRAFSRLDETSTDAVDLHRVLEAVVAMVGNEIRHRGRLVTDLARVPPVHASSARLEHVFLNLLLHVAQDLTEGEPENEIRLALRGEPPGRVVVEVSQRAQSLDPVQLERVFDPFVSSGADGEPVRLGLSLCHSIVSSLGGNVEAESQPGSGTTFRVSLPADETPVDKVTERRAARRRAPIAPTRRARVMVVDDDSGIVSALRLMLEDDHDVTAVASGPEALRMLVRDDAHDIVFCDLMMPELSGKDLYEALQLNCPGRERRLVFMTGGAFTPEAARFMDQVPNPRIEKPFDMDSVRRLLQRAVQGGS